MMMPEAVPTEAAVNKFKKQKKILATIISHPLHKA
jgi:hypothetical protein